MATKEEFKQKIETKINNIKKSSDVIEEQFNVAKEKASEEFEELKEDFKVQLEKGKKKLADLKDISDEKKVELKTKFEELQLQLALGKADTKDKIKEQKKKISAAVHNLDLIIDDKKEDFEEFLDKAYADFSVHMDTLGDRWDKAVDEFKVRKEGLKPEIDELKEQMEEWKVSAGETWDDFEDNVSDGFNKLKGFFFGKDKEEDTEEKD